MTDIKATNATSSGVVIDPTALRRLMTLHNGPGLRHFVLWLLMLLISGYGLYLSTGTHWFIPAMLVYATIFGETSYAISHETAHGTYVKSRWLNTAIFWASSLIYFEDPMHRYNAHMRHHNFTWINGMDAQISQNPLYLHTWLLEFSNLDHYWLRGKQMIVCALGIHSEAVRSFTPERDLPKQQRASLAFVAIYSSIVGVTWWVDAWDILLTYVVIPRLVGGIAMQAFTITQHAEMAADQYDIRKSCRSFDTNWVGRFLGCDMNRHVEHHLYPKVPFHALYDLEKVLGDQLPKPARNIVAVNLDVLVGVLRRKFRSSQSAVNNS
jgi:fatty acid desaturase